MKSIRNQLNVSLMSSVTALVFALWWIANTYITNINQNMMLGRLQHDSEAILASLQQNKDGTLSLKELQVGHIYQRVFSGHYFVIKTENQFIRSHSLWDENLKLTQLTTGQSSAENMHGPNGQQLLQWSAGFERFGEKITLYVAEDISELLSAIRQFNLYFTLISLLALVLSLVFQQYIVKKALQPLITIKNELKLLAEGEINKLSNHTPKEIYPLVEEINHLLQLLNKQLQRSRKTTGNLAHSLKQPLTLLMNLAESSQLDKKPELKQAFISYLNKIHHLTDSELKRAKIMGAGVHGHIFKPQEEIPVLVDVLQQVYPNKKIKVQLDIEPNCRLKSDRNDMLELFGNVLDNAFKWSKSLIICKIFKDQGLIIKIEDDGNGCDKTLLDSLSLRGTRIDTSTPGTGLGLSIVKDIVELYHGNINYSLSPLGGLLVTIDLPNHSDL
ncbi:MAG: GHKL domain-containing protein [Alcanivoracaceae bacterium]|nr:GHKL domain-containing protein [Alcanivoracaceae bacterium]